MAKKIIIGITVMLLLLVSFVVATTIRDSGTSTFTSHIDATGYSIIGNINPTNLTGDLPDSKLSANVPLKDASNSFTTTNSFTAVGATNTVTITKTAGGSSENGLQINIGENASGMVIYRDYPAEIVGLGVRKNTGIFGGTNTFLRNLASGDTAEPLVYIANNNAGDDQYALQINSGNPDKGMYVTGTAYFVGNVSALNVIDRTPFYDGDALTAIKNIRGNNGEIDHSSLPDFVRQSYNEPQTQKTFSNGVEVDRVIGSIKKDGRNLGNQISVNVKALQQLIDKVEDLETELCYMGRGSFC